MNARQTDLIKSTWQRVVPVADQAASLFYRRLFEIAPGLAPHFAGVEMRAQRGRLLAALSAVVDGLDDFAAMRPRLEALGRRHVAYGASASGYDAVGAALLWTLREGLGAAWNADVEDAWREAYGCIAQVMRQAADEDSSSIVGKTADEVLPRADFRPGYAG
jgi:nitric oxide dioxygenase